MNYNFIAFRFCDNDFHGPLQEAIEYIVATSLEPLTIESYREFVLRGMVAFHSIRRIDNRTAEEHVKDYRDYFEKTLTVSPITRLDELNSSFEGYVLNMHYMTCEFYSGG